MHFKKRKKTKIEKVQIAVSGMPVEDSLKLMCDKRYLAEKG